MKNFIPVLLFLIPSVSMAAATNLPGAFFSGGGGATRATVSGPQASLPAAAVPDSGGTTSLYTYCGGGTITAGQHSALYSMTAPNSNALGSTFPAGKTFYAQSIMVWAADLTGGIQFGYGTGDTIAENTATAPVGAVYYGASSTATSGQIRPDVVSNWINVSGFGWKFPGGTYPFIKASVSAAYSVCISGLAQ